MRAKPDDLQSFTWELRRCFREMAEAADAELEPLGLGAGERAILEFLSREPHPVSMAALARTYAVSRQHIHQSIRRPPLDAWVEERADPEDGRSVLITLNAKGRGVWKRIQALDGAFFAGLSRAFTQDEIRQTAQVLRKIRSELSARREVPHGRT